jgi:hypothetical protein
MRLPSRTGGEHAVSDRQNSEGHPCPRWCVIDHVTPWHEAGYTYRHHGSAGAHVEVPGQDKARLPAEITVSAVSYGQAGMDPAVIVSDNRLTDDGRARLDLNCGNAVQLASLLDLVATASPAAHRKLATAIREAAALITGQDADPAPGRDDGTDG